MRSKIVIFLLVFGLLLFVPIFNVGNNYFFHDSEINEDCYHEYGGPEKIIPLIRGNSNKYSIVDFLRYDHKKIIQIDCGEELIVFTSTESRGSYTKYKISRSKNGNLNVLSSKSFMN